MKANAPPLVTVILAAHGKPRSTVRAIDSVRRQTLGAWEMIVVPLSTSELLPVLVAAFGDERIHLLRGGVTAERVDRGYIDALARARGRHVAFLDSDAEWAPEKLERQLSAQHAAGARWSYTNFTASGTVTEREPSGDPDWRGCSGNIVEPLLHLIPAIAAPTVIVDTTLLRAVGGGADPHFDLWLRLASAAPAVAINEPLALLTPAEVPPAVDELAPLLAAFLRDFDAHAERTKSRRELRIAERQGAHFAALLSDIRFSRRDRVGGIRALANAFIRHPLNADWPMVLLRWIRRELKLWSSSTELDYSRLISVLDGGRVVSETTEGVSAPTLTGMEVAARMQDRRTRGAASTAASSLHPWGP